MVSVISYLRIQTHIDISGRMLNGFVWFQSFVLHVLTERELSLSVSALACLVELISGCSVDGRWLCWVRGRCTRLGNWCGIIGTERNRMRIVSERAYVTGRASLLVPFDVRSTIRRGARKWGWQTMDPSSTWIYSNLYPCASHSWTIYIFGDRNEHSRSLLEKVSLKNTHLCRRSVLCVHASDVDTLVSDSKADITGSCGGLALRKWTGCFFIVDRRFSWFLRLVISMLWLTRGFLASATGADSKVAVAAIILVLESTDELSGNENKVRLREWTSARWIDAVRSKALELIDLEGKSSIDQHWEERC